MKRIFIKRSIIVVILIFGMFSGFVLIDRLRQGDTPLMNEESNDIENPIVNVTKIKRPQFKNEYPEIAQTYELKSNLPTTLSLPANIHLYTLEKNTFEEKDGTEIANALGFTSKPATSKNYAGETVHSYFEGSKSLEVLMNQRIINLSTGNTYSQTLAIQPNPNTLQQTINEYLSKNKLIGEGEKVEIITTQALREGDDEGIQRFNTNPIIGLSVVLSKKLDGYPILTAGSQSGNIEVTLNAKLEVVTLRMTIVPQTKNEGSYPTKTREELIEKLPEATLQEISTDSPGDIYSSSLTTISITSVQIAYVPVVVDNQTFLHPVYALKGIAHFFNRKTAPATLYLPAIDSEYFE